MPVRGVHAGISSARQASENLDVCSGPPVTELAMGFVRPLGATPLEPRWAAYLEHESETRAHLLQLVIDAASVERVERPAELDSHITRLWRAIEQLIWTRSPHEHRRLVPDPAADNRRLTASKFLALVDASDGAPRMVPVDRLRDAIAVVDRFLGIDTGHPMEARRGLELVRAELVALVTP